MTDTVRRDELREALIEAIDRVLPRGAFHETAGYVDAVLAAVPDAALAAPAADPRDGLPCCGHPAEEHLWSGGCCVCPCPAARPTSAAAQPEPSEPGLRAADRALAVPHREDDQLCGCDGCMAYGAEDAGADWYRLSPARRIALRVLDSGDDRFAPLVTTLREHDEAAADSAPGEGLMDVLLARLVCDDDEEPCDADGRGPHRWCDNCIARAVIAREYAALSKQQGTPGLRERLTELLARFRERGKHTASGWDAVWAEQDAWDKAADELEDALAAADDPTGQLDVERLARAYIHVRHAHNPTADELENDQEVRPCAWCRLAAAQHVEATQRYAALSERQEDGGA